MTRAPIRAVVADDEPAAREAVTTFLEEEDRIEVVGEASDGRRAVEMIRDTRPDLLFLDVQMPDLDGFGVLRELGPEAPRGLVFVTAHDQHALQAFEVHALDYVLKPFGRPRFRAAVERALRRLEAEEALDLRRTLRTLVERSEPGEGEAGALVESEDPAGGPPTRPSRLGVRVGTRTLLVDVEDIHWIEAEGDYARIHEGDRTHLVSERMHALEALLDPVRFFRIHRSVIVPLQRVRELRREADGGGVVVLDSDIQLRVARGRWEDLQSALGLAD